MSFDQRSAALVEDMISALTALEDRMPTATSAARVSAARNRSFGVVTLGMPMSAAQNLAPWRMPKMAATYFPAARV